MEQMEKPMTDQADLNAEETTEQTAEQPDSAPNPAPEEDKLVFSKEEFDSIVGRKKARVEAKLRKEYEKKYGDLEDLLKAGTGKSDVGEITDTFRQFYKDKGIAIPQKPVYSDRDVELLSAAEADDIIRSGMDEVVDEVERLSGMDAAEMSKRDRAVFTRLAEYRKKVENERELKSIGVTEEVYGSDEFKSFTKKFRPDTPVKDIYDLFEKTRAKKDIKTMGSMKNEESKDDGVKEFYTREEALKFSRQEIESNPELVKAIEKSMLKW